MPDPSSYDNMDDFVSACISQRQDEHPDESNDQSVAICMNMWSEKNMTKAKVIHKTHVSESQGMEFILSDATIDRYGDSIEADGWVLDDFKKNPIALFNHNTDFVVGRWENLGVKNGALRGKLRMAPAGTSPRIDEIRSLIDAGILKAVSVGFRPIESKPIAKGVQYLRSELVECSVVSVPANPNALAVAKSLKVSRETMDVVFAKHGKEDTTIRRSGHGEHAKTSHDGKRTIMSSTPISVRVEETQNRIVALRDELTKHLETVDDANPDQDQTAITESYTNQIDQQKCRSFFFQRGTSNRS